VLIPAVVLPGLIFNLVFVWPIIERKFTNDNAIHNLLDRPSNRPKRTAAGVTMLSFLGMLFIASSTDVLAKFFNVSLNDVLVSMRYLTVIVPILAFRSPIASATRFRRCTAAVDVRPRTSSRALKRVSTPPRRRRATWTTCRVISKRLRCPRTSTKSPMSRATVACASSIVERVANRGLKT